MAHLKAYLVFIFAIILIQYGLALLGRPDSVWLMRMLGVMP